MQDPRSLVHDASSFRHARIIGRGITCLKFKEKHSFYMIKTSTSLGYIRLFVHPKAASTSRLEAKKSRNVDHLDAAFRRFYI